MGFSGPLVPRSAVVPRFSRRPLGARRLDEQLKALADEHVRGRKQTELLVKALRKAQVRGQWGELQLKRAVERANLHVHCDFDQQVHLDGDDGVQRPGHGPCTSAAATTS
ncbi:DNA recombination protein RmuC [Actinomadura chokoriensis]|uniref:DNA recombination protein RmuC n=1 Tax=Actinomadura chokoriensis TaxID=454156 RepID=UPI00356A949A